MEKFVRRFVVNLQHVVYLCSLCISALSEIPGKASTITQFNMRTDKNLTWGGQPYEAPTVTSLDILSEGLLCQSFGDPGKAGKDLNEENLWEF